MDKGADRQQVLSRQKCRQRDERTESKEVQTLIGRIRGICLKTLKPFDNTLFKSIEYFTYRIYDAIESLGRFVDKYFYFVHLVRQQLIVRISDADLLVVVPLYEEGDDLVLRVGQGVEDNDELKSYH
jgi:hypothetical protein